MDTSRIINPEAKRFINSFLANRRINKEFYKLVPEDKFDFRMVNTSERKSDSPRESLVHQIDTTRDYINGVKTGDLKFRNTYEDLVNSKELLKSQLLQMLEVTEEELIQILADSEISNKVVQVPWSKNSISAIASLWGLDSHEILHTGWNLAVMDHLNIERFPALKNMWG